MPSGRHLFSWATFVASNNRPLRRKIAFRHIDLPIAQRRQICENKDVNNSYPTNEVPLGIEALLAMVAEGSKIECKSILENGRLGMLADVLLQEVTKPSPSFRRLFDTGMNGLPSDEARPNEPLSDYFFVLSSIKGIAMDVRDLAMDAMVYCENEQGTPTGTVEKLKSDYNRLRARLP